MNELSTIVSGFGGQGVILAGKTIARSGMEKDLEVTWLPSYGPEMRGGTANCTVILSSELIGSPVIDSPSILLAFNSPSLKKFGPTVGKEGTIVYNSSLVDSPDDYQVRRLVGVPANDIAKTLGSQKVINMVMLGSWAQVEDWLELEDLEKGMKLMLREGGKEDFIEVNVDALQSGFDRVEEVLSATRS